MTTSTIAPRLGAWLCAACLSFAGALPLAAVADTGTPEQQQAARQESQPLNNSPVWRELRQDKAHLTNLPQNEGGVLIQSAGNTWRQTRNGPVTVYGGTLILVVAAAIAIFYAIKGPLSLHDSPTGRLMERFPPFERLVHWTVAGTFVILAITGLGILFGKHVLIPIIGHSAFGYLMVAGKTIHNYVGPLFALSTVAMIVIWAKDNVWHALDAQWISKAGGLLTGEHVPSGRFNFGEKSWFWIGVTILGLTVAASGLFVNFPNFEQGRADMQTANLIHSIASIVMMALSFGHIYMGTIGVKGAFQSMKTGYVDETWAREHHEQWYVENKKSG